MDPNEEQKFQATMRIDITPAMLNELQQAPERGGARTVPVQKRETEGATAHGPVVIRVPLAARPLGGEDFQALLQSIYDAVFVTDAEGNIVGTNRRAEQFFGTGRSEICKRRVVDWLCGADDGLLQTVSETLGENRFVLIQALCQRADGSVFPAEIAVCRLRIGGKPYLGFFIRDITLRKEAEERVKTGVNALQNAGSGIAVTDVEGMLAGYVNPAMLEMLGLGEEEAPGYNIMQFVTDAAVAEEMVAAAQTGEAWRGAVPMRRKDGTAFDAQVAMAANVNPDGVTTGIVVSVADVTQEKEQQRQLEVYAEQLRQRNAEMAADLRMARDLQYAFLPASYPASRDGAGGEMRFAHIYRPSGMVGGDFFTVSPMGEGKSMVFVADVMGHGARAALAVATIRGMLESIARTTGDPGAFLTKLNAEYSAIFGGGGELMFATAICAVFDLKAGEVRFAEAGHPMPMVLEGGKAREGTLEEGALGPALGLFPDAAYESWTRPLRKGMRVLFYTDGLTEAHVGDQEEFGEERMLAAMEAGAGEGLKGLLEAVVAAAEGHIGGSDFDDDVCVLGVEYGEEGAETPGPNEAQGNEES